MMKKQYFKPEIDIYSVSPSAVLAGSMNPGDVPDPSLSPEFDTDDLQLFLSDSDDLNEFDI